MIADHLEQSLLQLQKRQVEFHIVLVPIILFCERCIQGEWVANWLSHSAVSNRSYIQIPVLLKVLGGDGIIC